MVIDRVGSRTGSDDGRRGVGRPPLLGGLDGDRAATPSTGVPAGSLDDLRPAIAWVTAPAVPTDDPVLRLRVPAAVAVRLERLEPLAKGRAVVRRPALVVLPGVDQFVAYRSGELLPAVGLVGVPRESDRDLLGVGIVEGDAGRTLQPRRGLPVDLLDGDPGKCSAPTAAAWAAARSSSARSERGRAVASASDSVLSSVAVRSLPVGSTSSLT